MSGVRFSPIEERHLDSVLSIEKASNEIPWSRRAFELEIGHAPGEFIVASRKGQVAGYAGAWIDADECHITTIAVDQDVRRQGLGRQLMVEILVRSRDRGALCSTLEVRKSNTVAIALYEALGYVDCGTRKRYYPNDSEDAVIMWLHDLDTWDASA